MKFRKKPIVVEAYQLTEEKEIHTREGTVKGYPGDWIITGIQGEVYPCGKEIFEQTYEPADTRASLPAASCVWKLNDEYGMYETGCGNAFECIEGDIEENKFKFCPYCGGRIKEIVEGAP